LPWTKSKSILFFPKHYLGRGSNRRPASKDDSLSAEHTPLDRWIPTDLHAVVF
jgi:hypothetical protein